MDDAGGRTSAGILNWMPSFYHLPSAPCCRGKKKGSRPNSGFIGKLAEPGRVSLLQMLLASVQQDVSVKNAVLIRSLAWH